MTFVRQDFAETFPPSGPGFHMIMTIAGEVYREAPGRKTVQFTHRGKSYFLKAHLGVGWKEIIKNLLQLRLPVVSATTEWHALHRLRTLGIETLTPVGYGCKGINPAGLRSFIITEDLGETNTLEELCCSWNKSARRLPAETILKRALIRKVAAIARHMHDNGVNHRDFYLCHLRVPSSAAMAALPADAVTVYVMDLHRAQLRRRTPERWRVKDLGSLYFSSLQLHFTRQDRFRFIKAYTNRSLRQAFWDQAAFWKRVDMRARKLHFRHYRTAP